jgi:hypothetical protein
LDNITEQTNKLINKCLTKNNKKMTELNVLKSKRFVIRKSLIGKNQVITFTTKKGDEVTYNHDVVYEIMKDKLEEMACFIKYKSYTATNNIPTILRDKELV